MSLERKKSARKKSDTAHLFRQPDLLNRKIMEEAFELTQARRKTDVAWEAADVLYFTLVKLAQKNVPLDAVLRELERRHRQR